MALRLVTAEQMRRIEADALLSKGLAGIELMERAGQAIAETLLRHFEPSCVGIVAGKGNNAGDGLVVARLLAEKGVQVRLLMLTEGHNLSESGQENFRRLPPAVKILDRDKLPLLEDLFEPCEVIVDAILGTGISGPVKGSFGEAIAVLNSLRKPILAIDIPSGLDAETGHPQGACILADLTVTLGLPKIGLLLGEGPEAAGELLVKDIGLPPVEPDAAEPALFLLEMQDAAAALPPRPVDSHKGTYGTLLVVAGQMGMSGAAYLTAATALRSGCGMVFGVFPPQVARQIDSLLVECVKIPLDSDLPHLSYASWEDLEPCTNRSDAIALGPGLGTHPDTARLVDELVCLDRPIIVDADALNCLGPKVQYLTQRTAPTVLTPHPGEMARLTGASVEEICADRIGAARKLAGETRAVVVLKGARTVVALPDGRAFLNPTGNSGLAKGGSGDVLTGLIGGLLAQGCTARQAACAGVYLHGMAGDLARDARGERGMTATDTLSQVPEALRLVEE